MRIYSAITTHKLLLKPRASKDKQDDAAPGKENASQTMISPKVSSSVVFKSFYSLILMILSACYSYEACCKCKCNGEFSEVDLCLFIAPVL